MLIVKRRSSKIYSIKQINRLISNGFRQCEEAIAVLQNDNEQLEQEKSALKERLKQLTKNKLVDDLMQKKIGGNQRTSGLLSKNISRSFFCGDSPSVSRSNQWWTNISSTAIIITFDKRCKPHFHSEWTRSKLRIVLQSLDRMDLI